MANQSDLFSNDLEDSQSFQVNTDSGLLSPTEADTDIGSISTSRTNGKGKQVSSLIHKHTRTVTAEEKARIKKSYFRKYCVNPDDPEEHHFLINNL